MKTLLKRIFLFISLVLFLIIGYNSLINFVVKENADFYSEKNEALMVIGHSHPKCAYNDSIISNFKNYSEAGENYFYNYTKLKEILKQNQSLNVVFIEFTTNNILKGMDSNSWSNEALANSYPLYAPFLDITDNYILLKHSPSEYVNAISLSLKIQTKRILKSDYNYTTDLGGFKPVKKNLSDSLLTLEPLTNTEKQEISYYNLNYLRKIVTYCRAHKLKVYFVKTPYHEKYKGKNYEKTYYEVKRVLFPDVELLNFENFPLKNEEFGDLHHLNEKGAIRFSQWFDILLDEGILLKQHKQKIIDLKISKLKKSKNNNWY